MDGHAGTLGSVLLIEDNDDLRDLMVEVLSGGGFTVEAVSDPGSALAQLASTRFSLVLTDYLFGTSSMSEQCAIALLNAVGDTPVVCTSAWSAIPETIAKRYALILKKPIQPDELLDGLRRLPGAAVTPVGIQ